MAAFVTKHIYRTPSGRYYDDRTGSRVGARSAAKAVKNKAAMDRKFRGDDGRVELRSFSVTATRKPKGLSHAPTDRLETFSGPIGFDHEPDDEEEVRRAMNRLFPGKDHFEIAFEETEE